MGFPVKSLYKYHFSEAAARPQKGQELLALGVAASGALSVSHRMCAGLRVWGSRVWGFRALGLGSGFNVWGLRSRRSRVWGFRV